jgi:hypothetical protein
MMQRSEIVWAKPLNATATPRPNRVCMAALFLSVFVPLLTASGQVRQRSQPSGGEVVDYMVATVNGGLITYSDLIWQLALQPGTPLDDPPVETLKRALELLINQRLIYQEAEKLPHIHAADKEVETALAELIRHFPSQAEFQQRATRTGLTAEQLREIVRERVEIDKYLDFRFRSFTVVTPREIESYYRDVYAPRFRRQSPGRILPNLEEVRAEIERTLTEAKIESDMQKFLEEAREGAEIVILNPL